MRPPRAAAALAALLLAAPVAAEAPASSGAVALSYSVGPGAESCPDERWIRQSVAGRLGYDPFDPQAPLRVEARILRSERALTGHLEVTDADGAVKGRRQLTSSEGDCLELASAMELAIAIAVDPLILLRPDPPPAAAREPEPEPEPDPPASPPPVALGRESRPSWQFGLGPLVTAGVSPSAVPGLFVLGAVRWERFNLGLEARADGQATVPFLGGEVTSGVFLASVVPCVQVGAFAGCGIVSGGAMQVTGQFAPSERRVSSPLLLAGVRAQGELPLIDRLFLVAWLQAQAVLTRTSILSGAQTLWVTAPFAGAAGVAVAVRIP